MASRKASDEIALRAVMDSLHLVGPTVREMADALGVKSSSGGAYWLNRMVELGYMHQNQAGNYLPTAKLLSEYALRHGGNLYYMRVEEGPLRPPVELPQLPPVHGEQASGTATDVRGDAELSGVERLWSGRS
jgi:hypothetical protein